ncbi:MFS transporter [Proteus sp. ZN5]|uniref:MFS transporter n=1 Tax=Proteus sp. ZN5 TaxID=2697019 RepID=UPI0013E1CE69|nr:MFS transporter [Proteus sp. ZN5]QIG06169.1 MFS transporter [Proteus sp. ZN5]
MNTQQRIALFVLLLAGFVTIFDLFVVNVAIVNIEQTLNATLTELTLIIVGYELAFGLLLITGGRLGDIYGQRTLYRIGMFGFTLTSVLCAISPNAISLVIARCLQGLTAALLFPQVYSSIRLNFDDTQAKKVFGLLGMTLGLAAITGQALGGLLISLNLFGLEWRTIFLINLIIGIVALALSHYLTQSETLDYIRLDIGGVILSAFSITFTLLPLLMLPIWGWKLHSTLLFLFGLALLMLFIYYENRLKQQGKQPLFDLILFTNHPYVIGIGIVVCVYATSSAFPMMMSILLQSGFKRSVLDSGLIFVPSSIAFVLSSLLTPKWVRKFGEQIIYWGGACYALSYLFLIGGIYYLISPENSSLVIPFLFLVGFTQGMIMTPMLNLVLAKVKSEFVGIASGLTATLQQIGAAIGATCVSIILQFSLSHTLSTNMIEQYKIAFSFSMVFNFIMAICATFLLRKIVIKNK